ncbi:hypothetical protein D3C87_2172230 [compost metagenome]
MRIVPSAKIDADTGGSREDQVHHGNLLSFQLTEGLEELLLQRGVFARVPQLIR